MPQLAEDWVRDCKAFVKNKAEHGRFPQPPQLPCEEPACNARLSDPTHPLRACQHSIRQPLGSHDKFNVPALRAFRLHWHPDRYSSAALLPFKLAAELFKVAEHLTDMARPVET